MFVVYVFGTGYNIIQYSQTRPSNKSSLAHVLLFLCACCSAATYLM